MEMSRQNCAPISTHPLLFHSLLKHFCEKFLNYFKITLNQNEF